MVKRTILLVLSAVLLMAVFTGCNGGGQQPAQSEEHEITPMDIVAGGKGFTEQFVLAYILAILLEENTIHSVTARPGFSATATTNQALIDGEIDVFIDYSGTMFMNVLDYVYEHGTCPDYILERVTEGYAELGFTVMESVGFENTFALVMSPIAWERFGRPTRISDLAAIDQEARLGMDVTFRARDDGYVPLSQVYGFNFRNITEMEINLGYQALHNDELDILVGYSTDGAIARFDLIVLEDDLNFFPPYHAVPLMRTDFYEANPDIVEVVSRLHGALDSATMAGLNAQVVADLREPSDVAREWLLSVGLI